MTMRKKLFSLLTSVFELYSLSSRIASITLQDGQVLDVKWKPKRKKASLRDPVAMGTPTGRNSIELFGQQMLGRTFAIPYPSDIEAQVMAHMAARSVQAERGESLVPGVYAVSDVSVSEDSKSLEGTIHLNETDTQRVKLGENPAYRSTIENLAIAFRDLAGPYAAYGPSPIFLVMAERMVRFPLLRDQLIDTVISSLPPAEDKDLETLIDALKQACSDMGIASAHGAGPDKLLSLQDKINEAEESLRLYKTDYVAGTTEVTEPDIDALVSRFLSWKLPANFNPDGGIHFEPIANQGTEHERKREPIGTNLFDASQAAAMIRYLLDPEPTQEEITDTLQPRRASFEEVKAAFGLDFADSRAEGMEPSDDPSPATLVDDPAPDDDLTEERQVPRKAKGFKPSTVKSLEDLATPDK